VAVRREEFTISDVIAETAMTPSQRSSIRTALNEMSDAGLVSQRSHGSQHWHSNVLWDDPHDKDAGRPYQLGPLRVLHVFADRGVEAEALCSYGDVVRIGWQARDTNDSRPIRADAHDMPIAPEMRFDLGVFHPPCTRWSEMTSISGGDPDDHPNLIPLSREIAESYCDAYIIENKPRAPLKAPEGGDLTRLQGRMFGLPMVYERAFETSFPVGDLPEPADLPNECSPYFYSDRTREWWASMKGYAGPYTKTALAKNSIPAPYMHFLLRAYLRHANSTDGTPVEGHGN
jgi:hypothetical protein